MAMGVGPTQPLESRAFRPFFTLISALNGHFCPQKCSPSEASGSSVRQALPCSDWSALERPNSGAKRALQARFPGPILRFFQTNQWITLVRPPRPRTGSWGRIHPHWYSYAFLLALDPPRVRRVRRGRGDAPSRRQCGSRGASLSHAAGVPEVRKGLSFAARVRVDSPDGNRPLRDCRTETTPDSDKEE